MTEETKSGGRKKIGKFFTEYKNFNELTLVNKIFHIILPIICLILVFNIFCGGYQYKSVKEFQKTFCDNIGVEYSADEWVKNSAEETGSYNLVSYDDGTGALMLMAYYENDEVIAAGISKDMRYMDTDMQFLWECAAVSAMLDCDMEEAASIIREANFAHNEGETVTELDDGIKIYPYIGTDSNITFFMIQTEKYDY